MNIRVASVWCVLLSITGPALAREAENPVDRALFRFLFPSGRIEKISRSTTIRDGADVIRAERLHTGWQLDLPAGRSWKAVQFGFDGWRVRDEQGRVITLRPIGGALLAGFTFEGQWREFRPFGSALRADAGMTGYFDHPNRNQQRVRNEVKGLPTRSRLLKWRRE